MKKYLVIIDKNFNSFVVNNGDLHLCHYTNGISCCEIAVFKDIINDQIINMNDIIPVIKVILQNYELLKSTISEQLIQSKLFKRAN